MANGQPGETEHSSALLEIDELGRQLVAATTDRILAEAQYRAASQGDPEAVIASDPHLLADNSNFATALLQQIHARRSDLEQEQAQLSAEHGPGFPRVVEIGRQLQDLDRQKQAEDTKLVERFRSNWQTALDREQLVRNSLAQATDQGMKLNEAATEYAVMRQEANASHDLYLRVEDKAEEAGLAAGVRSSNISVVDYRSPASEAGCSRSSFVSRHHVFRGALDRPGRRAGTRVTRIASRHGIAGLGCALRRRCGDAGAGAHAEYLRLAFGRCQLPANAGDEERAQSQERACHLERCRRRAPCARRSSVCRCAECRGDARSYRRRRFSRHRRIPHTGISSSVRVSTAGTVMLPLIGEVKLAGMDEQAAARAIEAALVDKGMLLHPLVSVLVTAWVGQDVSVLGEVTRPGVYPYTVHHRLLDLLSAASGLSPNAGRLVNVFHQGDPKTPHAVALDPGGTDTSSDHNPELSPGDTVQVSRAGLVYVVGDVIRPGGFAVDPVQGLTVVQALSLAWGPSQNAAVGKVLLIREQKGGRTMIALNIRRMLRGQDPDQPVQDRDILYVPDSVAKNLANRTLESAIQSAIGVTIYSALVYSQRY